MITHGFQRGYQRAGIFPVELIHDNLGKTMEFESDPIHLGSARYRLFAKNQTCVACGVVGTYYAKERNAKFNKETTEWEAVSERWHFNLYATRPDGSEVMMTKDHIIPRSRGGKDHDKNYQTMCETCNTKKKNRIEGETPQEREAFLQKLAKSNLSKNQVADPNSKTTKARQRRAERLICMKFIHKAPELCVLTLPLK